MRRKKKTPELSPFHILLDLDKYEGVVKKEVKPPTLTAEQKRINYLNYLTMNGKSICTTGNIYGDIEVIKLQGSYYCIDKTKIPTIIKEFKDEMSSVNYAISVSKIE
jgi:hypothetical protein